MDIVIRTCQVIYPSFYKTTLENLSAKLAGAGFDLLVIDTIHYFIEFVPISLDIPYIHIWNILEYDQSGVTPASLFDYPLDSSPQAREKNLQSIQKLLGIIFPPLLEAVIPQAAKLGLNIDWNDPTATVSKLQ